MISSCWARWTPAIPTAGTGARRVPLALYPFARERHWLGDAAGHRPRHSTSPPQPGGTGGAVSTAVTYSADPVTGVEDILCRLAGETIELEPGRLDPTASLVDYGFDSLTMKTLSDRISRCLDINLPPTAFFEHSGMRGLAARLVDEYGDGLLEADHAIVRATRHPHGAQDVVQATRPLGRDESENEPVAVIGMSGRFPGSEDVEVFWANLRDQRDLVTEVPPERWNWRALDDPDLPEERRCPFRWGAFLDGVDEFDPLFFGISPAEAQMMDPQQRLLLQTAWATIESAGYRPSSFAGQPVGLFAGIQFSDYQHLLHEAGVLSAQAALGNEHSIAVNRISYLLDLRGPSETVNTACSSSLVAVHRAVQSLRCGESTVALAGGIALNLSPHSTIAAGMMGMLSPEGRCKTLDSGADGYVKGEGVGLVMLNPLSRAVADQDQVLAVIRGTGVGHGGGR